MFSHLIDTSGYGILAGAVTVFFVLFFAITVVRTMRLRADDVRTMARLPLDAPDTDPPSHED